MAVVAGARSLPLAAALLALACLCGLASAGCNLQILAVGDSITQGAVPSKGISQPYSLAMERALKQRYPCCKLQTTVAGEHYCHPVPWASFCWAAAAT